MGYGLGLNLGLGRGGSVSVFNPAGAPGLLVDWDFTNPAVLYTDSGTTLVSADGDVVGQVTDPISGYHLRQTDGTAKGLYKTSQFGGYPAVKFDGVNDNYACTASASVFQFLHQSLSSVYILFKPGLVADPNVFMAFLDNMTLAGSVGSRYGTRLAWDDRASVPVNEAVRHSTGNGGSSSINNTTANAFLSAQTLGVISFLGDASNATAASRSFIRKNSGAATQNNASTVAVGTTAPTYALTVGAAAGDAGFPFAGYIGRILIYNQLHGTTDRQFVENGLIARYGVT